METSRTSPRSSNTLYEEDFYAWTQDQASKLRQRAHNAIDWDNTAEEIESVGASQKNEISSRMVRLIQHLLKWEYQPERRGNSWQSTISEQRIHIESVLDQSPSLKSFPKTRLDWAWKNGVRMASRETGKPERTFPTDPAYSMDEILDHDFMPGIPWNTTELNHD